MLENDYKPLYKHAESLISTVQQNSTLSRKNARNVQNSKFYKRPPVEINQKKKHFRGDSSFCMKLHRPQRTFINCSEKVF